MPRAQTSRIRMQPEPSSPGQAGAVWPGIEARRFLDCVHCGLCLSACPTYVELGAEADSPRGRIYLMKGLWEGALRPAPSVVRHLDRCLGCRACESACPSGVRYGELLEDAREHVAPAGARPWRWRARSWLVHAVMPYPRRLRALLAPVRAAQALGLGRLPARLFPPAALLPRLRRTERLAAETPAKGPERHRVALMTGCVNSVLFGATNAATVRVLARNGCRVFVPPAQGCCGALHAHAGRRRRAMAMARAMIDAFPEDVGAVIVNAAGCGSAMKEYGRLLRDDPEYSGRARAFAARVRDATEFLAALPIEPPRGTFAARVTCHDACHLAHAQGIRDAPRALARAIGGVELVELNEADHCCGSAGSYSFTEPAMARRLMDRKADNVRATGAEYILAANPGCVLQIAAGLRKKRIPGEVIHPVELLDRAYRSAE